MGVAGVVDRPLWGLPVAEKLARLEQLTLAEREIAAERLALIADLIDGGQPGREGYRAAGAWLRDRLRVTGYAGRKMAALAKALDGLTVLAKALAKGEVSEPQAVAISEAVTALEPAVGLEVKAAAELCLVDQGALFEPEILTRMGKRILDHVAPEIAEEQDRKRLERDEKRAWRDRALTVSADGTGRFRVHGWLTANVAAKLNAVLDPLASPLRGAGVEADHREPAQRRHDGLGELCDLVLAAGDLPDSGGEKAQVVVTVAFDPAVKELSAGTLDTGVRLSAEAVRRWCCDAGIIPAVLGGAGQILDLGRERRLVSGALRRALVLRDKGCAFPGCDRPPKWTQGHHIEHWSRGGRTCLENCVLLCSHHHRVNHHDEWVVRMASDGLPEFIPPAWLDPDQRPRRNQYHCRG